MWNLYLFLLNKLFLSLSLTKPQICAFSIYYNGFDGQIQTLYWHQLHTLSKLWHTSYISINTHAKIPQEICKMIWVRKMICCVANLKHTYKNAHVWLCITASSHEWSGIEITVNSTVCNKWSVMKKEFPCSLRYTGSLIVWSVCASTWNDIGFEMDPSDYIKQTQRSL